MVRMGSSTQVEWRSASGSQRLAGKSMQWHKLGLLSGGFALGAIAATVISHGDGPARFETEVTASARSLDGKVSVSSERADYERRIAELTQALQTLETKSKSLTSDSVATVTPDMKTALGFEQRAMETSKKAQAMIERAQTAALLGAGFTQERINWIRSRTDELRVEFERRAHEGKVGQQMAIAYMIDPDLDLTKELSEEEYGKYREALGRPAGIRLEQVLPSSSAQASGLKPGDEILRYGGNRVYNEPMMKAMIKANGTGTAAVEVLRDGRKISLVVAGGPLGIRAAPVSWATGNSGSLARDR